MKNMWHDARRARCVTLALCASCCIEGALALIPDPLNRVSFARHGGDWTQGSCGSRNLQSPITINELYVPATGDFSFWYRDFKDESFNFFNDGRSLFADFAGKNVGFVSLPHAMAPRYDLYQIHVHSPSEHTLRGEHLPLELQLVHRPTAGFPGKQLVTVSLLFNCSMSPMVGLKQTFPGLLQTKSKLRAGRKASRRRDEGGSATLAQEERSSSASASGFAGGFKQPARYMPDFNPQLQTFVRNSPPIFMDSTTEKVPKAEPFQIGDLFANGTFAMYRGSQTLPPCEENTVWLVRREPIMASNEQVNALFYRLYSTTDGHGNFRTVMPTNQRPVEFWTATKRTFTKPATPPPGQPSAQDLNVWSQDAITISKAASDYARDINARLSQAAVAQHQSFDVVPVLPPVLGAGPTGIPWAGLATEPPPGPEGDIWAAKQIGNFVKQAVNEAVAHDLHEVVPAATNLASGYIRKALLKAGGWPTTTTTTLPPPTLPPMSGVPGPVGSGTAPAGLAGSGTVTPVTFTVLILNVDYAMLTANAATKALFISAASSSIVSVVGNGINTKHLELTLSPGSVVVTVVINVPSSLDSMAVQNKVASSASVLAATITRALTALPSVMAVSPGGAPAVGDIGPPMMSQPIPVLNPDPNLLGGGAPSPFAPPAPAPVGAPSPWDAASPAPAPAVALAPDAPGADIVNGLADQLAGLR